MDFLECPNCQERHIAQDAGGGDGWVCRDCAVELHIVARELSGSKAQVAEALHAHHLEAADRFNLVAASSRSPDCSYGASDDSDIGVLGVVLIGSTAARSALAAHAN
jgi:hypothetical protein